MWTTNLFSITTDMIAVTDINGMAPSIMETYQQVKTRQDELEDRRKDADEKLAKLRDLVEQVSKLPYYRLRGLPQFCS